MRQLPFTILLVSAALAGCAQSNPGISPPPNRFYYPTGITYVPGADGGQGFVYVVSSNFDLRFNRGTLAAVDVSTLPLPADGGGAPVSVDDAHVAAQLAIDTYGGPLATYVPKGASATGRRLFVAGRQNNVLDVIDVDGASLKCARDAQSTDCANSAIDLNNGVDVTSGSRVSYPISDAYRPFVADGHVYVGHLTPADSPHGSETNPSAALARVDAETLNVGQNGIALPDVVPITIAGRPSAEPIDGMAQVGNFLFLGGRAATFGGYGFNADPFRVLLLNTPESTVLNLSNDVLNLADVRDTRAMAVSSDGTRLYVVTRAPDALLTLDITYDVEEQPVARVLGIADLPAGATELAVIPRGAGRRDVVAVTCSSSNVISIYDDEIGRVTATIRGGGEQPFGVAYGPRPGGGVRLYSTAFGRGTLAVTDFPNLDDPTSAAVLANFGPNENCLNDNADARPPECAK